MSDAERDELAHLIDPNALELDAYPWPRTAADRVLGSDWLARVKAETAAEALDKAATEMPTNEYSDSGLFHRPMSVGDLRYWLRNRAESLREQVK